MTSQTGAAGTAVKTFEQLCKKLTAVLEGVSPILTREIAWSARKTPTSPAMR